jgi:hypothetical protein
LRAQSLPQLRPSSEQQSRDAASSTIFSQAKVIREPK